MLRVTLLVFISCCFINLSGQDPYYINYDTKDGLPSSEVYDIEVDQNGLVWFTTDRGVCTYDGYDFKTYTTKDGLADNTNFEIYRDSKERLWFTGYSGKVSIYEHGNFKPYVYNDSLLKILNGQWVEQLIESKKHSLCFTITKRKEAEVFSFDVDIYPHALKKEEYDIEDGLLKLDSIVPAKTLYFHKRDYSKGTRYIPLRSVLAIKSKSGWISYNKHTVFLLDSNGAKVQSYDLSYNSKNIIDFIFLDKFENLWTSTSNGLFCFKNGDLLEPPLSFFENQYISSITLDKENNYWVSTTQNGVYLVPDFGINVKRLSSTEKEPYFSIGKLKEHIVFGSSNSRIVSVNKFGEKEIIFNGDAIHNKRQIRNFSKIKDELHFEFYKIIEKEKNCTISDGFPDINTSILLPLPDSVLLVSNYKGFFITNENNKTLFSNSDSFKKRTTTIVQDLDETIWFGTLDGLFKVNEYQYRDWQQILSNGQDPFGRVNDIHIDHLNNRWISTIGNGLFYHTNDQLFQIKNIDGLNSNLINHTVVTNDSILWVATNKGLNAFNYKFENDTLIYSKIKSLTTVDGLSSNYIYDIDYWNNEIWLATNDGICHFDPNVINRTFPSVKVKIDDLMVNDSSFTISDKLVFKPNQNDVYINYTGISFRKESGQVFYKYRLRSEIQTPEWFYTNEKSTRYNDLDAGMYTFEVAAQNKSGDWSPVSTSFSFEIQAHFTETTWFKTISVLFGFGIISLIAFYQIKRIQSKEQEKRKLQEAQLQIKETRLQLQSAELSSLRNQMNPHFVFNSLNSIQNFIFKKDVEKANYYLSKFSGLMRDSLQYTRLDYITLQEEINFIKNYLELEKMRFADKFEIKIEVEDSLDIDFIMVPSLLLQPVLENSVKHAFKNIKAKGLVEVTVSERDEDSLDFFIRDNGPGILSDIERGASKKTGHKSLGLEIIRDRIKLLNDTHHKTKASVEFTNLSDLNEDKTGLQVHFILPIKYKQ